MLALGIVALLALQGELPQAVQREQRTRAWAVSPALDEPDFRAALASSDWRERYSALDSLTRARPAAVDTEQLGFVRAALSDEQPNVRAKALEVYARFDLELPSDKWDLVEDAFPEVRRQCVRALSASRKVEALASLSTRFTDEDERVSWEALCAAFVWPESIRFEGDSFAAPSAPQSPWRALGEDFELFSRAVDAVIRDGARFSVAQGLDHVHEARDSARHAFLLASVASRLPGFEPAWDAHSTSPFYEDSTDPPPSANVRPPTSLVDLWLVSFGSASSNAEREGRARLLEAAQSFDLASATALLERAISLHAQGLDDADQAWNSTLCLEGVHAAIEGSAQPGWIEDLAQRGLGADGALLWHADFAVDFWSGLIGAAQGFEFERTIAWLDPSLPTSVRVAATEAFADTWQRHGQLDAGKLLGHASGDANSEVSDIALTSLVGPSPRSFTEDLELQLQVWNVWRAEPLAARVASLRQFDREVRLDTPWREELVRLWISGEGCVVSIPELLAANVGDAQTIALLDEWLDDDLTTLEASEVPDVETTRGAWRETETRALWLLKAWTRATEHEAHERGRELVLRCDPLGKELTKVIVGSLAKSRDGGEVLAELFEAGELARRTRIEIALLVPALERDAARRLLLASYATCDEELRLRCLERLGELQSDDSRAMLLAVALDRSSSAAERVAALDALSRAGQPAEVRPHLQRIALESDDLDQRRAAISALGAVGDTSTLAALYRALDSDPRVEYLRDELLPAIVLIELRLQGALSERMTALWCVAPQQRAARELAVRFRGERLPNAAFVYSDVVGVADALARHGQLERALPAGWESFDARLLLELGKVAANGGDAALGPRGLVRKLNHAALVGLLGEGDAPDRDGLILRARARLLELALAAEDWRDVEGWAEILLEDWRTSRTTSGAFRAVLGGRDANSKRDANAWLRATRAQARARLALERGDQASAQRYLLAAAPFSKLSERARRQQDALSAAVHAAED